MEKTEQGIDIHEEHRKLEEQIERKRWQEIKAVVEDLHPADTADLIQSFPPETGVLLLLLLSPEKQLEVFSEMEHDRQIELLEKMNDQQVREVLSGMEPDDRVALFEEMPPPIFRRMLNMLSPENRKETLHLLGYPENSVGRLMTPDFVAVRMQWTVERAVEHIRKFGRDAETIDIVYVVDDDWRLLDDMPLRRIILAAPKTTIKDLMDGHFISIGAWADQEEAASLMERYNLIALPVVNDDGILLGIVTVDDILEVMKDEHTEDMTRLGAVRGEDSGVEYVTHLKEISPLHAYTSRAPWLFSLVFMDIVAGGVINMFSETISRYVVLASFIPAIIGTAGNAGSQTATIVIRALALGTVRVKDWFVLLGRETVVALSLGVTMGAGISLMGMWRGGWHVAVVVSIAMTANVMMGCIVGLLMPLGFAAMKKDPASASIPLITSLSDVLGATIYLTIAHFLLIVWG